VNVSARRQIGVLLVSIIVLLTTGTAAYGHALQPGYLALTRMDVDLYAVVWKTPEIKSRPMKISAVLPESCDARQPTDAAWDGTAYVARWTTRCPGGLEGGSIEIIGLDQTRTDVLVRFDFSDGRSDARRLTPNDASFTIPVQASPYDVVKTYLTLGFEHILSGIDHLLFVFALLLLVTDTKRLVATVTAFTIAHSITLAGATLGVIHVPTPPVEATIALSIMFVAAEVIHKGQGRTGLTARAPWIVAFIFGLLHGLGFAGALTEIGLPETAIPTALLFFNVGVELGQLSFIAGVLVVGALVKRFIQSVDLAQFAWARAIPAYAIGSLAALWTLQRLADF
jgi:hydrogenase/urease accessory protein HupE